MPWLSRSLCSHARLARLVVRSPIVTAPGRAFTPPPSNFAASRHTLLCHVDSGSVNHLHTMAGFDRFLGTHSGSSSSARMLSTTISNVALPRLTAPTRGLPPSRFSWLTGALLSVTGTRNMSSGKHRRGGARAAPERKVPKLRRQPSKKYKLKSHKGALKRFYQTGHGTFVHKASGKKHLQAGASRRRQTLRKKAHRPVLAKGIERKLRRLLPYGTTLQPPPRHSGNSILWERPDDWREQVEAAARALADAQKATRRSLSGAKKR